MQAWEYKTAVIELDRNWGLLGAKSKVEPTEVTAELNNFGADGWELVSTEDLTESAGVSKQLVLIFKRPKTTI